MKYERVWLCEQCNLRVTIAQVGDSVEQAMAIASRIEKSMTAGHQHRQKIHGWSRLGDWDNLSEKMKIPWVEPGPFPEWRDSHFRDIYTPS